MSSNRSRFVDVVSHPELQQRCAQPIHHARVEIAAEAHAIDARANVGAQLGDGEGDFRRPYHRGGPS
ncbi:hypothetical protein H7K44_12705 [Mycobacterium florentinum]|nr:hypothetical protein [Mycobacterium florentinum]